MNGQRAVFAIIGIVVGFIGGFILANSINRNAAPPVLPNQAQLAENAALSNQPNQTQITAQMPDVAEALAKAENEPENLAAQMKVGDMYAKIERFDKAVDFFARANQIKPGDFPIIVKLGNANFEINNFAEAEKWYSKALEIKPDDVDVRSDLGLVYYKKQPPDLDRAIQEYAAALAVAPNHERALQNLTVAYWDKKDAGAMRSALDRLEKVSPQNPVVPKLKKELELLEK